VRMSFLLNRSEITDSGLENLGGSLKKLTALRNIELNFE